jgi:hypothetical protein
MVNAMPWLLYPQRKAQCPLYRTLGGPQSQSGQVRKISPPPGFDPWTVQSIASCYTDYAISAPGANMVPSINDNPFLFVCPREKGMGPSNHTVISCSLTQQLSVQWNTFPHIQHTLLHLNKCSERKNNNLFFAVQLSKKEKYL